jgi:hypothetical protein
MVMLHLLNTKVVWTRAHVHACAHLGKVGGGLAARLNIPTISVTLRRMQTPPYYVVPPH